MSTYLFHVLEPRRGKFVIEWHLLQEDTIKEHGALAAFLYWAKEYKATYRIARAFPRSTRMPRTPVIELHALDGTHGEYRDGLYWQPDVIFRMLTGTHYLTQHGLDGLPREYFDRLYRTEQPIFRVEPYHGGVYSMTMDDWFRHFASGQNETDLDALALTTL